MAAIHSLAEELQQGFEFRRGRVGFAIQQAKVAARLTQTQEGGENLHAGGSAGLARGIYLGARGNLELRVGGFLVWRKLHLHDLFDLRWKFLEDF